MGAAAAIAAIAYGVYRYFAPDYLDDFEGEIEDEFDDDFFEDDEIVIVDAEEPGLFEE